MLSGIVESGLREVVYVCVCVYALTVAKKGPKKKPIKLSATALPMILGCSQKTSCKQTQMMLYTNSIRLSPKR